MTSDLQALMFMSCNLLFLLYTSSSTLLSVKSSLWKFLSLRQVSGENIPLWSFWDFCAFWYFNLRLKLWVTHKQRLSAGCQYMSFSGVRKSYLRVTTSSSFMWCRLGPSDSSSSPQQNMKLDGPTSWSPDGQEASFSKHSWTCSAIPAQTTEGACRISGCFFMCFRFILQREMNIQERTGLHLSFTIRSAN